MKECWKCGNDIIFRKFKGETYRLNPKPVYVVPDEKGKEYLSTQGNLVIGREAADGNKCYRFHRCGMW